MRIEERAKLIMREIGGDEKICNSFGVAMLFLKEHPNMIARYKKGTPIDDIFIRKKASQFLRGRSNPGPAHPDTVPDPAVKTILRYGYGLSWNVIEAAIQHHMAGMGAENFIGWALEAYIGSVAEEYGWIWCTGEIVRFVDFIRLDHERWQMLQIKNRNNSENSASSSVREGTTIQKWFRFFAKSGKTNWATSQTKDCVSAFRKKDLEVSCWRRFITGG